MQNIKLVDGNGVVHEIPKVEIAGYSEVLKDDTGSFGFMVFKQGRVYNGGAWKIGGFSSVEGAEAELKSWLRKLKHSQRALKN